MTGFIRRVVTGHDKSGKAIVISDELAPKVHANPLRPNHRGTEIWRTTATPAPIPCEEPDPTFGPRMHVPPLGTLIRIAELGPETGELRNLSPEKARAVFKEQGHETSSTWGRGGRHPMMHRTASIDYAVVLEGEITLVLDDQDVQLNAGDVVIQRGTNHSWSNRSRKRVRMLYILIDGRYDPELEALFKTVASDHGGDKK